MRHANDVTFHLLTPEDVSELLRFEIAERDWFEQHIEARPECFYTPQGVAKHMIECLALNAQRKMNPLIIRERGVIIGRANLRNIQGGDAKAGYRIAQSACGRGIAQMALKQLMNEARCVYGLTQLAAVVAVDNVASQRVLEKAGFRIVKRLPRYSTVNGELKDCRLMEQAIGECCP
ncbi:GNAT family N-acetyltransferase [Vreelandella lutescens]|uniref:Alanine acetyltransferase n=1 Tax=Vreelandella lutescens TaxID=1602943 RepID=A0ABQ1NHD8_9GAMM|nr:GNAT family N-acetyltransferase [Halomonas lutescens]GGC77137.1 alanine acetyltransferase [Halomonas lutescens]